MLSKRLLTRALGVDAKSVRVDGVELVDGHRSKRKDPGEAPRTGGTWGRLPCTGGSLGESASRDDQV